MKNQILAAFGTLLLALSSSPSPGQSATNQISPLGALPPASSSLTFSNSTGQMFTVDQLATQLRNLRSAVDQTLPMLTAFTQNFAAANSGSQNLAGRLEGLVSGALARNNSSSPTVSNLLGSLRGVLGTNASPSMATDARTLQELTTLQNDLQPLPLLLQNLSVGGSAATPSQSQIISAPANASATTNVPGVATPTPTGRP